MSRNVLIKGSFRNQVFACIKIDPNALCIFIEIEKAYCKWSTQMILHKKCIERNALGYSEFVISPK